LRSTLSQLVYRQLFAPAKSKMQVQESAKEDKAIVFFCPASASAIGVVVVTLVVVVVGVVAGILVQSCHSKRQQEQQQLKEIVAVERRTRQSCRECKCKYVFVPHRRQQQQQQLQQQQQQHQQQPATYSSNTPPGWPPQSQLGLVLKPRHQGIQRVYEKKRRNHFPCAHAQWLKMDAGEIAGQSKSS